ncbi:anti-sigma factor antagonist [Myxococcus xanthus]|uniref:anti-sigma factor antagonist n=1 Tax=Myxococcus xanthus TaxID=34 RepID=UPI0013763325|nr:anti-sigma factor antagonist [Myxococcus xanthus]
MSLKLSGESRLTFINDVTAATRVFLREAGFPDATAEHVELAVAEAVANAIQHGNQGVESRRVDVMLVSLADRVTVSVRDEGAGFDVAAIPDALAPAHRLKPSGRGVLLMRALMDAVELSPHPEGGTVVRLSKQQPRSAHHTPGERTMSELNIRERQSGDVTLFELAGRITIGAGDTVLRETVRTAIQDGRKNLVLNLAEVTYLDSAGLGELVSSYTTTSREGGRLKLLSPSRKVQDLLMITKLITVFDVYDTEQAAVNSFK